MGQGLYTKVQAIVANAFGLRISQVLNTASRTDKVPNAFLPQRHQRRT